MFALLAAVVALIGLIGWTLGPLNLTWLFLLLFALHFVFGPWVADRYPWRRGAPRA